ncbi:hypothetical protein ACWGNM_05910 [Streptomyces sp. NPDC055796]
MTGHQGSTGEIPVEEDEVLEAELVDDALLPATVPPSAAPRPLLDRRTILHPGEAVPTDADAPTYTRPSRCSPACKPGGRPAPSVRPPGAATPG